MRERTWGIGRVCRSEKQGQGHLNVCFGGNILLPIIDELTHFRDYIVPSGHFLLLHFFLQIFKAPALTLLPDICSYQDIRYMIYDMICGTCDISYQISDVCTCRSSFSPTSPLNTASLLVSSLFSRGPRWRNPAVTHCGQCPPLSTPIQL